MWSPKEKREFKKKQNIESPKESTTGGARTSSGSANFAFGQYLAGLLEGDGTIIVPNPDLLKRQPVVRICFHSKDECLAVLLKDRIGSGHLVFPKAGNYVLLEISDKVGLCRIVNLTNGFFRTPKLEAFERLILWLQQRTGEQFSSRGMDLSPLISSAWLSGFTDADGNFNVILAPRKNKQLIRVQTQFRIEVRQIYHRASAYGCTYWDVISDIARLLDTNVYTRSRCVNEKIYYAYFLIASSKRSKTILRKYFSKYPLYSSKFLDYQDWCRIIDLDEQKEPLAGQKKDWDELALSTLPSFAQGEREEQGEGGGLIFPTPLLRSSALLSRKDCLIKCSRLKNGMNSKRTLFSWDHLQTLPKTISLSKGSTAQGVGVGE